MSKLKEKGLYDNTVILYASDHGSHFKTRNRDAHLNGYDDYKRSCHDGCLHVPLVICGGPFKGGKEITDLVSTESIPKTLLALAGSSGCQNHRIHWKCPGEIGIVASGAVPSITARHNDKLPDIPVFYGFHDLIL